MRRFVASLVSAIVVFSLVVVSGTDAGAEHPSSSGPASVPGELLVGYREAAPAEARSRARARANAQLVERVVRGAAGTKEVELVRLPAGADEAAARRRLEQDPAVAYAEPNWIYHHQSTSNDPYYTSGSLWGMYGDASTPLNQYGSQAAEAWAGGSVGSDEVYVGVIDEGIQTTHPDLASNIWTNPFEQVNGVDDDGNGYVDDTNGWDFANGDRTVYDGGSKGSLDKHGTHVAGTIGAVGGNSTGVAGVSWNVTMISGKFLGRRGGTTANAIKAVDYFTDLKARHGLNIVATNNSWGGGGYSTALTAAIERANNKDILFVAAAGNGGSDGVGDNNDVSPHYPSSYANANVIAVASITSSGAKSSFSNYGATSVDIGAPGSGIYSTLPSNKYGSYSGTSMATPHVSGAIALYAATHADANAAASKNAVLTTSASTAALAGKAVTGGRLNASGF